MSEHWETVAVSGRVREALFNWAGAVGRHGINSTVVRLETFKLEAAALWFREDVLAAEDEDGAAERRQRLKGKLDVVKRKARQEKP